MAWLGAFRTLTHSPSPSFQVSSRDGHGTFQLRAWVCCLFWDVQIWLQIYTRHHQTRLYNTSIVHMSIMYHKISLRYLSFPICSVSLSNDWSRAVLATNSCRGGSHFSVPKSCFLICQTQDSLSHNIRKHTATFYSSSQALKHLFVSGHSPATRMHTSPQRTITTAASSAQELDLVLRGVPLSWFSTGIGPETPSTLLAIQLQLLHVSMERRPGSLTVKHISWDFFPLQFFTAQLHHDVSQTKLLDPFLHPKILLKLHLSSTSTAEASSAGSALTKRRAAPPDQQRLESWGLFHLT